MCWGVDTLSDEAGFFSHRRRHPRRRRPDRPPDLDYPAANLAEIRMPYLLMFVVLILLSLLVSCVIH